MTKAMSNKTRVKKSSNQATKTGNWIVRSSIDGSIVKSRSCPVASSNSRRIAVKTAADIIMNKHDKTFRELSKK